MPEQRGSGRSGPGGDLRPPRRLRVRDRGPGRHHGHDGRRAARHPRPHPGGRRRGSGRAALLPGPLHRALARRRPHHARVAHRRCRPRGGRDGDALHPRHGHGHVPPRRRANRPDRRSSRWWSSVGFDGDKVASEQHLLGPGVAPRRRSACSTRRLPARCAAPSRRPRSSTRAGRATALIEPRRPWQRAARRPPPPRRCRTRSGAPRRGCRSGTRGTRASRAWAPPWAAG